MNHPSPERIEIRVDHRTWATSGLFPTEDVVLRMLTEAGLDTKREITREEDHLRNQTVFSGYRAVSRLEGIEMK